MNTARGLLAGLAWGAVMLLSACAQQAGTTRAQSSSSTPSKPASKTQAPSPAPARAADGSEPAASCNANAVKGALGQVPTASLAESARKQAGARSVRVIHHGQVITKEFLGTRLNLQLDAAGKVAQVYCG